LWRESGHRAPHLRDIRLIINIINTYQQLSINKWYNFSLDEFVRNHIYQHCHCKYAVAHMRPKKFRKTPSARRIFPKVFRRSHFWTYLSCPFLKTFSTLVQIRIEKITKKLSDLDVYLWEHNAALKKRHHGGRFFGPKKT
jgi:hypothetical protein